MIIEILHGIIGLLFALFIPGFLLDLILFEKQDILERIALSIGLSIAVDIFVGLFLGANKFMKDLTGGITATNIWVCLITISIVFGFIILGKKSYPNSR